MMRPRIVKDNPGVGPTKSDKILWAQDAFYGIQREL